MTDLGKRTADSFGFLHSSSEEKRAREVFERLKSNRIGATYQVEVIGLFGTRTMIYGGSTEGEQEPLLTWHSFLERSDDEDSVCISHWMVYGDKIEFLEDGALRMPSNVISMHGIHQEGSGDYDRFSELLNCAFVIN